MTNDQRDTLIQSTHDMLLSHITKCESCRQDVIELRYAVYGDDSKGVAGLKTRTERLENVHGYRSKYFGWLSTLAIAIAGSLCTVIATRLLAR